MTFRDEEREGLAVSVRREPDGAAREIATLRRELASSVSKLELSEALSESYSKKRFNSAGAILRGLAYKFGVSLCADLGEKDDV